LKKKTVTGGKAYIVFRQKGERAINRWYFLSKTRNIPRGGKVSPSSGFGGGSRGDVSNVLSLKSIWGGTVSKQLAWGTETDRPEHHTKVVGGQGT